MDHKHIALKQNIQTLRAKISYADPVINLLAMPRCGILQGQWAAHKSEIARLYIAEGRSLPYLMGHMRRTHQFAPSKSQYETQLGKWNLNKYHTKDDWQSLAQIIAARKIDLSTYDVLFQGKPIALEIVRRELARYGRNVVSQQNGGGIHPPMPLGFSVQVRDPFGASPYQIVQWHLLPSVQLLRETNYRLSRLLETGSERHLLPPSQTQRRKQPAAALIRTDSHSTLGMLYRNEVLPTLRACYPISLHDSRLAMTDERNEELDLHNPYDLAHLHMLLYRLSNNMFDAAQGNDLQNKVILTTLWPYIRQALRDRRLHFLNTLSEHHVNTITWKLIQAAIEVGDASGVRLLLSDPRFGLRINDVVCVYGPAQQKYTAIELCAMLCDAETAEVLVEFGADVRRSAVRHSRGALACALDRACRDGYGRVISRKVPSTRLVRVILGAGAVTTWKSVQLAAEVVVWYNEAEMDIFRNVLFATSEANRHLWTRDGRFSQMILDKRNRSSKRHYDVQLSLLQAMTAACPNVDEFPRIDGSRFIDTMATLGNIPAVEHLNQCGHSITLETMRAVFHFNITDTDIVYDDLEEHKLWNTVMVDTAPILSAKAGSVISPLGEVEDAQPLSETVFEPAPISDEQSILNAIQNHDEEECINIIERHKTDVTQLLMGPFERTLKLRDSSQHALFCAIKCDNRAMTVRLLEWSQFRPYEIPVLLRAAYEANNQYAVDYLSFVKFWMNDSPVDDLVEAIRAKDQGLVDCYTMAGIPLARGQNVSQQPSPIYEATAAGSLEIIRYLLENGADPYDQKALALAVGTGREDIFETLSNSMSESKPPPNPSLVISLLDTALAGRPSIMKLLSSWRTNLRIFNNINNQNLHGLPSLFCITLFARAIWNEQNPKLEVLRLILETLENRTARLNEVVALEDGRNIIVCRETPLLFAIRRGRLDIVSLLIHQGADVNLPPTRGLNRTPLQQAAEFGRLEILKSLIQHGARVEGPIAFCRGASALQLASIGGYCGIMEMLLQHGADVNAPGCMFGGRTAIEGAAEHGRLDAVKLLLDARTPALRGQGNSVQLRRALLFAKRGVHIGVIELLEEYRRKAEGLVDETR